MPSLDDKFAKLQVNKWHERNRYNSSKIGKYFLVYQTETKKIMYYLLRACTQKYSDTFWSKKYHITTASTYVHFVGWYFRHEHRRYSMKKNTNIRVFKHTRRAIIQHIVILYVSKINTSLTLKVKCVKKFKYIPGHFHKIFKSGLHLENYLAILLTNFKI